MSTTRFSVQPVEGYPPRVGQAVWRMMDCRRRTLSAFEQIGDQHLDALPTGFENSIGTLLYHLAVIEADWLYQDILGVDYPDWLSEVFPVDAYDESGRLSRVDGLTLDEHRQRLETVRRHFLEEMGRLEPEYLDTPRRVDDHEVTPAWVLHHLRQHEAEHRGEIQAIRTALGAG